MVSATLATTNARGLEHATRLGENANAVFGAVATVGPDAFAATMRVPPAGDSVLQNTFHLPGGLPGGGELSFSGYPKLESKSKKRGSVLAFARPKLGEAHEKVSFSRARARAWPPRATRRRRTRARFARRAMRVSRSR